MNSPLLRELPDYTTIITLVKIPNCLDEAEATSQSGGQRMKRGYVCFKIYGKVWRGVVKRVKVVEKADSWTLKVKSYDTDKRKDSEGRTEEAEVGVGPVY